MPFRLRVLEALKDGPFLSANYVVIISTQLESNGERWKILVRIKFLMTHFFNNKKGKRVLWKRLIGYTYQYICNRRYAYVKTQEEFSYQVSSKVSKSTYMKMKRLIDAGMFLNFSDFTRKAIENELERLGETEILSIRDASVEEARKLIEDYIDQHQGPVYPSDIADHYGLEIETVFEAVKQLKAMGKVKEAE